MSTPYSPIDESSYSDNNSFDPEAMLNQRDPREYEQPQYQPQQPRYQQPQQAQQPQQQYRQQAPQYNQEQAGQYPREQYQQQPAPTPQPQAAQTPQPPYQPQATAAAAPAAPTADTAATATNSGRQRVDWIGKLSRSVSSLPMFKFLGIALFFFAAYAFIVCCSYFFTIGSDQSAVLYGEADPQLYNNAGHKFGAVLAHTLIYDWLGIGAFILIFYLGACGLSMIGVYKPGFWNMTMRCLLSAIAISVIAGLCTYEIATPVYWGGMHGQVLNERLIAYSGFWGALFISLLLGAMMVMLYINELRKLRGSFSHCLDGFRAKQSERQARREILRAEARAKAEVNAEALAECERLRAECDRLRTAAEAAKYAPRPGNTPVHHDISSSARIKDTEPENVTESEDVPNDTTDKNDNTKDNISNNIISNSINNVSESDSAIETTVDDNSDDDTDDAFAPLFPSDDAPRKAAQAETVPSKPEVSYTIEEPAETKPDNATPDSDIYVNEQDANTDTPEAESDIDEEETDVEDTDEEETDVEVTPLFSDERDPMAADPRDRPKYDPHADLSHYQFPSLELLNQVDARESVDEVEMDENIQEITKTLNEYRIAISNIKATVGPTVTLYEIVPAEGVRIARIKNLEDDIALKLAALGIRIIAPIPGRGTVGIEVPNKDPQTVSMRSVFESEKFRTTKMDLPMAIGRTVSNEVFMADLAKMPHLLVAGATGMGKSVGLNAIIASLLYKKHPSELKFVMIDPKQVEFSLYAKLERHYLAKLPDEEDAIITDPLKVIATLNSLCVEMDNRYSLLKDAQMRNIKEYNERFVNHALNPERGHRYLPYIVVIVDEFADLIMTAGKEVETPIARIAQKARAVGIHMILATQRPSTNVITGVIKANFPGRIAFRVFQMVDSRTIIDRPGANQLIGRGDMLFSNNGKIERVQCAFIDTPEVTAICDFIDNQVGYPHAYDLPEYVPETNDTGSVASLGDRDPLFEECARLVVQTDTASTSSLQRRYSIGYNRAGKIMDQMEAAGIVGPSQGGKPRSVLVDSLTLERILENK